MPAFCVSKVIRALNSRRQSLNGSRVLVLGVAYKKNVNDTRESPALRIIDLLGADGGVVSYHDPFVATLATRGLENSAADTGIGGRARCRGGGDRPRRNRLGHGGSPTRH